MAAVVATFGIATPAIAYPINIQTSWQATTSGAKFSTGTGSIRAWQYCESSSGQTNWYNLGPWRGINAWSWTGTCYVIRQRGFDLRDW